MHVQTDRGAIGSGIVLVGCGLPPMPADTASSRQLQNHTTWDSGSGAWNDMSGFMPAHSASQSRLQYRDFLVSAWHRLSV